MKQIPEPDVMWPWDPRASVNRLMVHATWRSCGPLQMLSSTWQVTGTTGIASELIRCAPTHRNFGATFVPSILELDGSWMRDGGQTREEDASHIGSEESSDLVHTSIPRREFIFDVPLREALERGWIVTLIFDDFSGPLYTWIDRTLVGFCADGFIPATFDVTGALRSIHSYTLIVLLVDSPVYCHGLFREVSLEARPLARVVDMVPVVPHDGRAGALTLRVEVTGGIKIHTTLVNETE